MAKARAWYKAANRLMRCAERQKQGTICTDVCVIHITTDENRGTILLSGWAGDRGIDADIEWDGDLGFSYCTEYKGPMTVAAVAARLAGGWEGKASTAACALRDAAGFLN